MAPLTSDGKLFIAIIITLSALATVCGVTRIVIRRHGMLSVDDYILGACLVLLWYQATGATLRMSTFYHGDMAQRNLLTMSQWPQKAAWAGPFLPSMKAR